MNFNQWRVYANKKDVAKVTYCCGEQFTLVELVIDDIKDILQVPATDFVSIDASQINDVWELASQYPLDPNSNRLTIIRNADRITDWSGLSGWIASSRINPKNYIVFASYTNDAPSLYDKGKRTGYQEHIELIRTKGRFIKCSTPNDEDLATWVQSYGLTNASAQYLIERTSGDTATMLDVLKKVRIWGASPNPKALALFCDEQALDSFADYLILRDKKSAFLALSTMSEDERSRIISRLDYRLDYLMEIGRYVRRRVYDVDIAAATGIKIYLIKRFKPVVKDYDDKKIRYCRQLLAMIDGALKDGAKVGVWESLIALW